MRPYEVMFVIDAGLEEDAIRAVIDRTTEAMRARGANVGRVERWGRRRLAYEVRHRNEGYYVLAEMAAEPAVVADLDRMLRLTDEVIRHKVVLLPEKVAGRAARGLRPPPAAADAAAAPSGRPGAAATATESANGA